MRHRFHPIDATSDFLHGLRNARLSDVKRSTTWSRLVRSVRRLRPIATALALVAVTELALTLVPQSSPADTCDPPCLCTGSPIIIDVVGKGFRLTKCNKWGPVRHCGQRKSRTNCVDGV